MKPRQLIASAVLTTLVAACNPTEPPPTATTATTSDDQRTLGYVVSRWRDVIPAVTGDDCIDGFNVTEVEYHKIDSKQLRAKAKELGLQAAEDAVFPPDACRDPNAQPDPGFKLFDASVEVAGMDLDGKNSKKSDGGPCAHDDFPGPNGSQGIDHQLWRLLGCTTGQQPGGILDRLYDSNSFVNEGIPILFDVEGVDDIHHDDAVEVRFYSSADSVSLDANNLVMANLSLRVHPEARFTSAPTKGRIVDGVLETEPVDLRLRVKQQVIDNEFHFRDARIRAEYQNDGRLVGTLGYYWDAENYFRVMNDHSTSNRHTGRGAAVARGYMCAGIYNAIPRIADGHPDAEGRCTSISAAVAFEATPAFVLRNPAMASR